MGVAKPGVRPPGAASPSAKSIQEDEIPLAVMVARSHEKFSENTSAIPEVMDSSTLNFNPNFNFSRFFFWGGGPRPLRVCASKSLLIFSVCKKFNGASPPKGRNESITFRLWTKVRQFFSPNVGGL